MSSVRHHETRIPPSLAGRRLDQALADLFEDYSRSMLSAWIKEGRVRLNDRPCRPRDTVSAGDRVDVEAVLAASAEMAPEQVAFGVVYEDRGVIVVDKPAGLVVHPGAGNAHRTLVNGLLHRYPELSALPRAGLIHRLDKDTSGLLVVARTPRSFQRLTSMMAEREIHRTYAALVHGIVVAGGTIEAAIARDRHHRTRMKVSEGGREAVTHYRISRKFRAHTLLEIALEIVGDPAYGTRQRLPPGATADLQAALRGLKRQALHAMRLAFSNPSGRGEIAVESPLPADLVILLEALAADSAAAAHA